MKANEKLRKPTENDEKEFDVVNDRFDKVIENKQSNVKLNKKTFMKISDVDEGDAIWFKNWCDKHTDKKQFLGIKVIRQVMERLDPFLRNIIGQVNKLDDRITSIESLISVPPEEEGNKLVIPKTQGGKPK